MTAVAHDVSADPSLFKGTLLEKSHGQMTLGVPGKNYRLALVCEAACDVEVGKPITGRIRAVARRVDVIRSGGRYIEPLYGRPRRLQGRIVALDPAANTITVACGAPLICRLTVGQSAGQFEVGQLVSFDVERGASFEPVIPGHGQPLERPATTPDTTGPTGDSVSPAKTVDHGTLGDREITGEDLPAGDMRIDG